MKKNLFFHNYYNMLSQIRIHGHIAARELEKSVFNSVDKFNIDLTNKVPISKLSKIIIGEETEENLKYSQYIDYKLLSFMTWQKDNDTYKKDRLINERIKNSQYELNKLYIESSKNRRLRYLNNLDNQTNKRILFNKNILKNCFRYVKNKNCSTSNLGYFNI